MPIERSMGWNSKTTSLKQDFFKDFALFHLDWAHYVMKNCEYYDRKYRYWDLTAGAGWTEAYGYGSPILHAMAAEEHRRTHDDFFWVRAKLIEQDPDTVRQLNYELVKAQDVTLCEPLYEADVKYGDYRRVIREFLHEGRRVKEKNPLTGLVYYDSNGQIPDADILREINSVHPRLDLLMHVSATAIKRVRSSPACRNNETLVDIMNITGKRHWLVSELGAAHQWCFLFGTNYVDLKQWKKRGLYDIKSLRGHEIMQMLNYTSKEMKAGVGTTQYLW